MKNKNKTKLFPRNSVFAGMAKHSKASNDRHIKNLIKNLGQGVEPLEPDWKSPVKDAPNVMRPNLT
jgi:hypothetical protein